MNPLNKLTRSFENGTIPEATYNLILKRFSLVTDGIKRIEKNEKKTVIIQRRSICASKIIKKNSKIKKSDLICLRPSPKNSIKPMFTSKIIGKVAKKNIQKGECIYWKNLK